MGNDAATLAGTRPNERLPNCLGRPLMSARRCSRFWRVVTSPVRDLRLRVVVVLTAALVVSSVVPMLSATKAYALGSTVGGPFIYGDATFYGSTGGLTLNRPDRGHGRHPRRQGLLAGGLRRRHLHLRRRRLLRLDRRPDA